MKVSALVLVSILVAVATAAQAGGDVAAGEKKAQMCFACHGQQGVSTNSQYPILAGQYADYLANALKSYRNGSRKNAIMQGMAGSLSDQDIENLTAYFSAQKSPLTTKR